MKRVAHIYKDLSLSFTSIKIWNAPLMWLENISPEDIIMYSGHILPREQGGIFIVPYLSWHAPSVFAVGDFCDKQRVLHCLSEPRSEVRLFTCFLLTGEGPAFWSWFASMWILRWLIDWLSRVLRRIGNMAEVLKMMYNTKIAEQCSVRF